MSQGNHAKKGEPGRPAHVGFQPGHPPFYTGGSVPGHAPTSDGSQLAPWSRHHPPERLFGHPAMEIHRRKGGRNARTKQRECLEALQNAELANFKKKMESLKKRFPPGMVERLAALQLVAQDPSHKDFINAQRMVGDILTHLAKKPGEDDPNNGPGGVPIIELAHGAVDVPLPGSVAPPEPGGSPEGSDYPSPVVNGNGNGHQNGSGSES